MITASVMMNTKLPITSIHFYSCSFKACSDVLPTDKGNIYGVMPKCLRNFYSQRNVSRNQLVLQEVSEQFIYEELSGLNVTKSSGLDEISAIFLKLGADVIKVHVWSIINQSIRSGIVQNSMKQARVKLLFKKGSQLPVGNYRPITILNVVSKYEKRLLPRSVHHFKPDWINNWIICAFWVRNPPQRSFAKQSNLRVEKWCPKSA